MGTYENINVDFANLGTEYPLNYNPVHAIWQCLLKIGMPDSWLNSASFLAAAEVVHGENNGVSVLMRSHQPCLTYIKSLLLHLNGLIFYGVDGKFHIRLIRDDYTVSNLPVVNIDDLLDEVDIERGSWMETYGEVKIQYNAFSLHYEQVEDE